MVVLTYLSDTRSTRISARRLPEMRVPLKNFHFTALKPQINVVYPEIDSQVSKLLIEMGLTVIQCRLEWPSLWLSVLLVVTCETSFFYALAQRIVISSLVIYICPIQMEQRESHRKVFS